MFQVFIFSAIWLSLGTIGLYLMHRADGLPSEDGSKEESSWFKKETGVVRNLWPLLLIIAVVPLIFGISELALELQDKRRKKQNVLKKT